MAPGDLVPWVDNPRKNDGAVDAVAKSIERYGFGAPIVARVETREVIAGHTRLKAALLLGLNEVPVRLIDVSERDAHLLAIADNKLGEIADWDDERVLNLISDLSVGEANLLGFSAKELEKLGADLVPADAEPLASDDSASMDVGYAIVVECTDEEHQLELLGRFMDEGLSCRALT
jgi:ParB-like chromosome segregation protein Spo0J